MFLLRMREELLRRGGLPPRPGMPGMPPHDPYLEASRRYAAQAQAAAGLSSPYGSRECLMSDDDLMLNHFTSQLVIEWPLTGWRQRDLPWPQILSSGFRWPASILRYTLTHVSTLSWS